MPLVACTSLAWVEERTALAAERAGPAEACTRTGLVE